jgi:protocatechuate 3,4-dioxygenase beta subunit
MRPQAADLDGEELDLVDDRGAGVEPTPSRQEDTEDSIEGPYYRAGAPLRSTLVEPGMPGTRLLVTGRVLSSHDGCAPLAGARLDFWQADATGEYDNTGYALRGVFLTDSNGIYRLGTILPGRYSKGDICRPRHLHVKVRARGHASLTTQLYFKGDPYNAGDKFIHASLIMTLRRAAVGKLARFDFVLARSPSLNNAR